MAGRISIRNGSNTYPRRDARLCGRFTFTGISPHASLSSLAEPFPVGFKASLIHPYRSVGNTFMYQLNKALQLKQNDDDTKVKVAVERSLH